MLNYAVLYAAETVRWACWETLGRNRIVQRRCELPRAEAESALVVSIGCDAPLALVDLRGDGPVRIGAPSGAAHDANHAAGRALSGAVHGGVHEADGSVFASRFTGDSCEAIFERAFDRLWATGVAELARHAEFLEALDDYHIVLSGPPSPVELAGRMGSRDAGPEDGTLRASRKGRLLPVGGWLGATECFCTRDSGIAGIVHQARHATPGIRSNPVTI